MRNEFSGFESISKYFDEAWAQIFGSEDKKSEKNEKYENVGKECNKMSNKCGTVEKNGTVNKYGAVEKNGKNDKNAKLASPWVIFYKKLQKLFEYDKDVKVNLNEEKTCIDIFVDDPIKADALQKILPAVKLFGNVAVLVNVFPADLGEDSAKKLFKYAFKGNPIFKEMITIPEDVGFPGTYMMFAKEVVQYHSDDLSDPYGNSSTLYADIARDIFEGKHDGMYFSTSLEPLAMRDATVKNAK